MPGFTFPHPHNNNQKVTIEIHLMDRIRAMKMESTLYKSEEYFRLIVENIPMPVVVQAQNKFVYLNRSAVTLFGANSQDQLIGQPVMDRIHVQGRAIEDMSVNENRQTATPFREGRFIKVDGSVLDVEVSYVSFEHLHHDAALIFVRDIAERTDVDLRISEVRYRRLFEAAKDGILIVDAGTGMVLDVNTYLMEMLGYSYDQFKGKAIWELGFLKDIVANRANFFELQSKGYIRYENLPMETADGRHVDVEFVSNVYTEQEGQKVIQCNIRNITERKLMEDKLQSSLKEKNLLLHELNHRVNNNLQLMVNLASLQRKHITDEKTAALFDATQSRIKSIALVHEKLHLTKGFYDINFSEYLEDLAQSVFSSFAPVGRQLTLKVDVEDIRLEIERSVTCGLIINEILSNIFKYAFPGNRDGQVFISFHRVRHGGIELIIRDNGIGIPSDVDLRSTKSLGMRLIHNLVEKQLEGKVTIERGSGTCIKITFKEVTKNPNGRP
jgi:PAS domain S-box-containing protein